MKYNKIISITLTNGLALLVFASILASCQKTGPKTQGFFTNYSLGGRFPANLDEVTTHFDPKQVLIYCKINSVNNEQCFKQHFNEQISELVKSGKITRESAQTFSYEKYLNEAEIKVAIISKAIMDELDLKIYSYSKKKEQLCDDNKVIYLKQCLNNSVDADSIHILNTYQQNNPSINGQEYLFLKNQIKMALKNKLNDTLAKLKNKYKRNIVKLFDTNYISLKKKLNNNRDWLSKATSLPIAISSCVDEIENELKEKRKFEKAGINLREYIKEYFCMDYVNTPEVMKVVNYKHNENFERKLTILFEIIKVSAPEVVQNCVGSSPRSSKILNNCLENNWDKIVGMSYERWLKEGQNNSFSSEKEIIFERTNNISPKLKREISSNFEKN